MSENDSRANKRLRAFKISAVIAAFLAAATSAVAFLTSAEPETRYLSLSVAAVALYVVIAASVILAFSAIFLFKGQSIGYGKAKGADILSILPTVGSLTVIVGIGSSIADAGKIAPTDWLLIVTVVFAALFSLSDLLKLPESLTIASGYVRIFFPIILISVLYMDSRVELNAPVKLLSQFALAAVALDTLSDIRILIGRSRAGLYVFTKLSLSALAFSSAAASVISVVSSPEKFGTAYLTASLFALCCAIHSVAKLLRADLVPITTSPLSPDGDKYPTDETVDVPLPDGGKTSTEETDEVTAENDGE